MPPPSRPCFIVSSEDEDQQLEDIATSEPSRRQPVIEFRASDGDLCLPRPRRIRHGCSKGHDPGGGPTQRTDGGTRSVARWAGLTSVITRTLGARAAAQ